MFCGRDNYGALRQHQIAQRGVKTRGVHSQCVYDESEALSSKYQQGAGKDVAGGRGRGGGGQRACSTIQKEAKFGAMSLPTRRMSAGNAAKPAPPNSAPGCECHPGCWWQGYWSHMKTSVLRLYSEQWLAFPASCSVANAVWIGRAAQ